MYTSGPGLPELRPAAQPDQGDLLPAPADVQPDAERPGQQRLQLRDVRDHRPAPGRTTSAHAQQRYLPRPGDIVKRPNWLNVRSGSVAGRWAEHARQRSC